MYLDLWMIIILVSAFGSCAWFCTTSGINYGVKKCIEALLYQKIIMIDGVSVVPFSRNKKDISNA